MSFYTSLNGMKNAQTSLGVISHNIANSETYGFKRSRTEFSEIVAGSALTNPRMIQGIGASVESITQNFALGPVEQTGSALDLAITGDGFFTTRSASDGSTLYTRAGSFTMTESGNIADSAGNRLQVFAVEPVLAEPVKVRKLLIRQLIQIAVRPCGELAAHEVIQIKRR